MNSCDIPHQIIKSVSGNLSGSIEINSVKTLHNIRMIWDFEIRNIWITEFFDLHVAAVIFSDDRKREELNAIVHPAVREYVLQQKEAEERAGKLFLLVLEAALLIEEHYDEICDELWYIYTTEENRRARLKASRGYSDAHVDRIFASQLSEEEYRRHCRVVIDNNGTLEETLTQTEEALRREAYE